MSEQVELAIIDYGMGNLSSLQNAFRAIGTEPTVVTTGDELGQPDGIILPGVGAFPDGMRKLESRGFVEALERTVDDGETPLLGVCLGLQLLAEQGTEHGETNGLGWLSGTVELIDPDDGYQVPHMGWNDLVVHDDDVLCADIENPTVYFVHSYHFVPSQSATETVTATASHGTEITASIRTGNIFGVQFHPEKSQAVGLKLLENFVSFVAD